MYLLHLYFLLFYLLSLNMCKNFKKNNLTKIINKKSLIHFATVQHHLAVFVKKKKKH